MTFLKMTDPVKRDQIVKEYLETKKRIRDSQLAERTGEIVLQQDLGKFFRPITETQKAATKEITEGLKPIKEGIEQLPQRLPQQQLIPKEEEEEDVGPTILDKKYKSLKEEYEENIDKTFGITRKGINYYIGDKIIDYDGEYIWVGAEKYEATDALWELIMAKNPSKKHNFLNRDLTNYEKILRQTNVIFRDNKPGNPPKSSGGIKYNTFIKELYKEIKKEREAAERKVREYEGEYEDEYEGEGITIIPSNPNALLERLDLLMASKKAGNTGLRNELVSICDELKRQGVLKSKSYKNLMSIL